uniref:Uncharacterized protein n=1 Tax=Arundo donax TaxID=35708 RepID=A0A0A9ECC6_ARUDO
MSSIRRCSYHIPAASNLDFQSAS